MPPAAVWAPLAASIVTRPQRALALEQRLPNDHSVSSCRWPAGSNLLAQSAYAGNAPGESNAPSARLGVLRQVLPFLDADRAIQPVLLTSTAGAQMALLHASIQQWTVQVRC